MKRTNQLGWQCSGCNFAKTTQCVGKHCKTAHCHLANGPKTQQICDISDPVQNLTADRGVLDPHFYQQIPHFWYHFSWSLLEFVALSAGILDYSCSFTEESQYREQELFFAVFVHKAKTPAKLETLQNTPKEMPAKFLSELSSHLYKSDYLFLQFQLGSPWACWRCWRWPPNASESGCLSRVCLTSR